MVVLIDPINHIHLKGIKTIILIIIPTHVFLSFIECLFDILFL